jgi:mRNA interferase RelE/StbE
MAYVIHFDRKVIRRDLPAVPSANIEQIMRAIHERLTVDPIGLGKPLTGEFKGLYRLRVGDWRIIYKVEDGNVIIRFVRLRRDAYKG